MIGFINISIFYPCIFSAHFIDKLVPTRMPDESEPLISKVSSYETKLMIDLVTINLNAVEPEDDDSGRAASPIFNTDNIFKIQLNVSDLKFLTFRHHLFIY